MTQSSCRCRAFAISVFLASIAVTALAEATTAPTPGANIRIEHSGGKFDFLRVDAQRNRLLAAHEKDGTEDVIDLRSRRLLARLKVGGAVDTAMDPESRYYYVSVQDPGRVAVIDAESLREVKSVKTAGPTDAIIYEPKNHRVYVTHDDGAEVWVIDPSAAKVTGSVAIPGVPEFMVYDAQADRIYLNIKDKDLVVVIDPASDKVVKQWPTAPARAPHGLAVDAARQRIYSAGANGRLVAIDTRTGSIAAAVDITAKVDQIAVDAATGLVYCAGSRSSRSCAPPAGSWCPQEAFRLPPALRTSRSILRRARSGRHRFVREVMAASARVAAFADAD